MVVVVLASARIWLKFFMEQDEDFGDRELLERARRLCLAAMQLNLPAIKMPHCCVSMCCAMCGVAPALTIIESHCFV